MGRRFTDRMGGRCEMRWRDLTPRGEGRWCATCDTTVIDLSRLTRREARERVRGGACGRVRLDVEGEPIFRTETEGGVRAAVLIGLATLGAGCAEGPPPAHPPTMAASAPDGPPMAPLDASPEGVAIEELDPVTVAHLEGELGAMRAEVDASGGPTAEQRALTARKRRGRSRPPATPGAVPPGVEYLGFMDADF